MINKTLIICAFFSFYLFADLIDEPNLKTQNVVSGSSNKAKAKPKQKKKEYKHIKKRYKSNRATKNNRVKFEGDQLVVDRKAGVVTIKENVKITQGNTTISSDKAYIYLDKGSNEAEKIEVKGNVRFFTLDEKTGKRIRALSHAAVFMPKSQLLTLRGDAKIYRDGNEVVGDKVIYNIASDVFSVTSASGHYKSSQEGSGGF